MGIRKINDKDLTLRNADDALRDTSCLRAMFIPTWLIVLGVVLALSLFVPSFWQEAWQFTKAASLLLVLICVPLTLYFVATGNFQAAQLTALPLAAAGVLGILAAIRESIRTSRRWHEFRVQTIAQSPESIIDERRRFAEAIELGRHLSCLYEDIEHFPAWYAGSHGDGSPWRSEVIRSETISVAKSTELEAVGLRPQGRTYLRLAFLAQATEYVLFVEEHLRPSDRMDLDDEKLHERELFVLEPPSRIVLHLEATYYLESHGELFHDAFVHAFKPGLWLDRLLMLVAAVRTEANDRHGQWRKDREQEELEKSFL
jgi:hypothetical protein